jgi:hypothetical protein
MGLTAWAMSADGKLLALARSWQPLRVIALDSGKERGRFALREVNVAQISFAPDGERLVFIPMTGGGDEGTVELGSAKGGKSKTLARIADSMPTCFAWPPAQGLVVMGRHDGVIAALALDGSGERWRAALGQRVEALAAAPDGARLCATGAGGSSVVLLDGATGGVQRTVAIAPWPRHQRSLAERLKARRTAATSSRRRGSSRGAGPRGAACLRRHPSSA